MLIEVLEVKNALKHRLMKRSNFYFAITTLFKQHAMLICLPSHFLEKTFGKVGFKHCHSMATFGKKVSSAQPVKGTWNSLISLIFVCFIYSNYCASLKQWRSSPSKNTIIGVFDRPPRCTTHVLDLLSTFFVVPMSHKGIMSSQDTILELSLCTL